MNGLRPHLLLWLTLLLLGTSHAAVIEETILAPAPRLSGRTDPGALPAITVLVVRPEDDRRHPLAVLLHGRGVDPQANHRLGRADFPANARFLAERGYAVLIPTRIGYGITGGPDLEYSGPCAHKSAASALQNAALEVNSVLDTVAGFAWSDRERVIAIGDSFGGLIALALAAQPPAGLKAVVNVSGGDGGDSLRHVDTPCDPETLQATMAAMGRSARVPALFLYSANDRFWGTQWPHRWFEAWRQGGGNGQFVTLPADKNNGHFVFNRNGPAWQTPAGIFLRAQGLP
jgi:dienelactone hydrolase